MKKVCVRRSEVRGRETGKLAPYADYYVVNDHNRQDLQESARRIVDLFLVDLHIASPRPTSGGCISPFQRRTAPRV